MKKFSLVVAVVLLATIAALVFVFLRSSMKRSLSNSPTDLSQLPNQFPLRVSQDGFYELSCIVSSNKIVDFEIGDGTHVRNILMCDFLDKDNKLASIQVPLVLINQGLNTTYFIQKTGYKVLSFKELAIENSSKEYEVGKVVTFAFEPNLNHYKLGDPSIYSILGNWLENNHRNSLEKFLESGKKESLPKVNGESTIVPFFISLRT